MKKICKIILMGLGVLFLLGIIGSCMGGGDGGSGAVAKKDAKPKTYTEVSIDTLIDEAKANAAKAKQEYNGKDLKIVGGVVRNIDSDGDYVTVKDPMRSIELMSVSVKPRNAEQKKSFATLEKEKAITIYGTVSDVGDIMGFTVKLDKFEQ